MPAVRGHSVAVDITNATASQPGTGTIVVDDPSRDSPWWEPPTLASVDERLAALLSALSPTECIGTTAELAAASHADRLPEGEQLVSAAIERFERVPRT